MKIPIEVELNIFKYLIQINKINLIKSVSKEWSKKLDKVEIIRNKKKLENLIYMILEDYNKEILYQSDFADLWEEYHKYFWPRNNKLNYSLQWKINIYVDALDIINVWGSGKIIDQRYKDKKKEYLIRFMGWSDKFNEWVTPDKLTIFGSKTIHPIDKYSSLKGNHARWCLFKDKNQWRVKKLWVHKIEINQIMVKTQMSKSPFSYFTIINRSNINSRIRSLTDATVFLSDVNDFKPKLRELKY